MNERRSLERAKGEKVIQTDRHRNEYVDRRRIDRVRWNRFVPLRGTNL